MGEFMPVINFSDDPQDLRNTATAKQALTAFRQTLTTLGIMTFAGVRDSVDEQISQRLDEIENLILTGTVE